MAVVAGAVVKVGVAAVAASGSVGLSMAIVSLEYQEFNFFGHVVATRCIKAP